MTSYTKVFYQIFISLAKVMKKNPQGFYCFLGVLLGFLLLIAFLLYINV